MKREDEVEPDDLDPEEPDESDQDDEDGAVEIRCPNCKKWIFEDAEQCPMCGQYVSTEDPATPSGNKPMWMIIIILMLIAAMFVLARR